MWNLPDRLVAFAGVIVVGFAPTHRAMADGGTCMADLDGCGTVAVSDLLEVLANYGRCPGCAADFNADGVVDGQDLGYLLAHWGPCSKDLAFPQETTIELATVEITDQATQAEGLREFDVFATLRAPTDTLLNVFDASVTCDGSPCFVHALIPSALPLSEDLWDMFGFTYDSFVTVGAQFANDDLFLDVNFLVFSEEDFINGVSIHSNAGWCAIPKNDLGLAGNYPNNQVRIATFTTPVGTTIQGHVSIIYQDGADQLFTASQSFVIENPPCPWDCGDGDGIVGTADLLALLAQWGGPGACDFGYGVVGTGELLTLLANWGPCP